MNASERSSKTQTDGLCILETHRVSFFLCGIIIKQLNTNIFSSLKSKVVD